MRRAALLLLLWEMPVRKSSTRQPENWATTGAEFVSVSCATFSRKCLPAGIKACFEGPGPADGPVFTLESADGRRFVR